MLIKDLCNYLETIAPLHLQESYDNAGLICGKSDWEIKGVLISLDATPEVIREAITLGCNLIISHHPIIFSGLKKINGFHYVEESIIQAIKNDIALYAIHTNLDNVLHNGVNTELAVRLNLQNTSILSPKSPLDANIGAGMLGLWPIEKSYNEAAAFIKEKLNITNVKATIDLGKKIKKVAICGGSGAFLIKSAIQAKADLFISADIKYHEFFEANKQLVIFDVGHYESEQYTIRLLYRLITEKFSNFAAHCTKLNTNPVQFI